MEPAPPANVREVARGLDLPRLHHGGAAGPLLSCKRRRHGGRRLIRDNWIYVQEPDVLVGRLADLQQLEPVPGGRSRQGLAGPGIFLQRGRRAVEHVRCRDDRSSAARNCERIGIIDQAEVLDGDGAPHGENLPRLFRRLRPVRRDPRVCGRHRESVPDRPQRHAPLQQPGPLDADRHDGGGQHPGRRDRQRRSSGKSTRNRNTTKNPATEHQYRNPAAKFRVTTEGLRLLVCRWIVYQPGRSWNKSGKFRLISVDGDRISCGAAPGARPIPGS